MDLAKSAQENGYRTRHDPVLGLEKPRRDIHATNHQNLEPINCYPALAIVMDKWNYQKIKETIAALALLQL